MLQDKVIPFLTSLKENNNKDWFAENKADYQLALDDFKKFIDLLISKISHTDKALSGLTSKDCVYRIYRDVRFAKDKTPYKTHFGAHIAAGGRKSKGAGFYVHIEPGGNSITGGGIYMPEPASLKALRNEFHQVPEELIEILENPGFKKFYPGLWDNKLKLAPKGFPKDFEHIELLKHKSFVATTNLSDTLLDDEKLLVHLEQAHKQLYPLNRLLNTILDDAGLL